MTVSWWFSKKDCFLQPSQQIPFPSVMIKSMKLTICILSLFWGSALWAQSTVTATISNLSSDKGVCLVCLFDNAAAFAGNGKAVQCQQASVSNRKSVAVFSNIQPGTYAISVFHDANRNNKLDKNFFGIPKEGYGASRNKLPFAAAPAFAENKFDVRTGSDVNLAIKLRYL